MNGIEAQSQVWVSPSETPQGILGHVTAMTLAKRSVAYEIGFAVCAFGLALYIRFLCDPILPPGFPFLTFFPAVLLTSAFASVRAGVVVAVASGLASRYYFIAPVGALSLSGASAVAIGFYTLVVLTEILLITAIKQTLLRLRACATAQRRSGDLARAYVFGIAAPRVEQFGHRGGAVAAAGGARPRMQRPSRCFPWRRCVSTRSRGCNAGLHSPNIQSVAVADFIQDMAADTDQMRRVRATMCRCSLNCNPLQVAHEKAIPLGLIVSELLMNAVEHSAGRETGCGGDHHLAVAEPREGGGPSGDAGCA